MGFLLCNWMMMSLETAAVSRLSAQIFFLMFSSLFILFEKKKQNNLHTQHKETATLFPIYSRSNEGPEGGGGYQIFTG